MLFRRVHDMERRGDIGVIGRAERDAKEGEEKQVAKCGGIRESSIVCRFQALTEFSNETRKRKQKGFHV